MRFKNFVNNFSKKNRIFSNEDMYNMSLGNMFDNEDELYSQYKSIGFPTRNELETSPNVQWVEPYTNDEGQQSGGFWQSILLPEYQTTPFGTKSIRGTEKNKVFSWPKSNSKIYNNANNSDKKEYSEEDEAPEDLESLITEANVRNEQNNKPFELSVEKNVYEPQEEISKIENENNSVDKEYIEELINPPYLNKNTQNDTTKSEPKDNILKDVKENLKERVEKVQKDYGSLTPVEQAQKWASKHTSWWTPSEYYGISEYLADDGKIPEKYAKNNEHYKLGDINNERTKEIITNKVLKGRKDCPVGPYINDPLKDVDVIVPKDDSELVQKVKRSDEIKDFIEKHKSELDAGKTVNGSINFDRPRLDIRKNEDVESYVYRKNDEIGRFSAIHYADIVDAKKNQDGSVTMKVVDYYDFSKLNQLKDLSEEERKKRLKQPINATFNEAFNILNNNAYEQQELGKLKPYILYKEIKYKL